MSYDPDLAAMLALINRADEAAMLAQLASLGSQQRLRGVPEILHAAVVRDFQQVVKKLLSLDAGAGVDARVDGHTALHRAVLAGLPDMARLLIDWGADAGLRIEGTARQDMTALHLATDGTPALLRAVLTGARPAAVAATTYVTTPYDDVLRLVLHDERPEMLAVLRDYGLSMAARGADGLTPAQYLMLHRRSKAGGMVMLRQLERGGADLHGLTSGGETLLMLAARTGWAEAFEYLLAAGVDPLQRGRDRQTLLHAAALGPEVGILRRVLALDIDINAQNRNRETALHVAAHRNRLANVEALVAAGADPFIRDIKGRTPDMVCQARVQAMTRQAVLRAQKNGTPVNNRRRPTARPAKTARKGRIGPSKRR